MSLKCIFYILSDPCDPKIDENANSLCDPSLAPRSYIPGQDYVVFCDRISSVHEDAPPYAACFRAFDKAPTVWKCKIVK